LFVRLLTQSYLGTNQLTGTIPWFNMSLQYLYLDNNSLTGTIPAFNIPLKYL
jgi:hypothetical protein